MARRTAHALNASPTTLRLDACGDWAITGKLGHIVVDGQGYLLLAMLAAMRRASSLVSSLAADLRLLPDFLVNCESGTKSPPANFGKFRHLPSRPRCSVVLPMAGRRSHSFEFEERVSFANLGSRSHKSGGRLEGW
jgi:hypothetical protein